MSSKRYIPVLITIALLALLGLQGFWLYLVFQHKEQELVDKTREAVIQTGTRLQREEDSKFIINNMDSLLLTENIIGSDSADPIRVIVSNVKNQLKTDTLKGHQVLKQKIEVHGNDESSTTVVKVGNGASQKIIISSQSSNKNGSSNNTQSYSYSIDNYEKAASDHRIKLLDQDKKIIEQQKLLEEHLLRLKEREKQLAAKETENKTGVSKEKEALEKQSLEQQKQTIEAERQAIEAEKQAIEQQKQAIEAAKQAKIKGEYIAQIASIEIEKGKQTLQLQKEAVSAQSLAEKAKEMALLSQTKVKQLEKKAGELQTLFLKMAISSEEAQANIDSLFTYERVKKLLTEELIRQGVDLDPAFGVYFFPNRHPAKVKYHVLCNTPGFAKMHPPLLAMPFTEPIYDGSLIIKVDYVSTVNFVIKQMAGLLSLSLFITILIGFVMIYLFRRMLSQEKLHRVKNDFINNMAHELKTPIATISLAVDGINNPAIKNDNEKFNNYTSILKEENKKLNTHIERVLQTALLEKGELKLETKKVELNTLLKNCLDTYRLQIENKKAKVELSAPGAVTITGDEFHLSNAFTNLLDNALKYSGENCEIHISLVKNGNTAEIIFKDNGIGIRKDLQSKVFEKFYRVQGGNIHDVKGSGLGLSYVKSIIEAHGGTIELRSEEHEGSEFIIKLRSHVN